MNHMSLNEYKTKFMIITSRQKRQNIITTPSLYIKDTPVYEVTTHKVLGVIIDQNLNWSSHVNNLCKRISQKLFQLSKIKKFLDFESRKIFYHAFISSYIDYASTLYDLCSEHNLKPLARIHKRCLKAILLKSTTLTTQDYFTLGILPLSHKLQFNKATLMFRIMNGFAPTTLLSRFPKNQSRYTNNILIKKNPD